MKKEKIFKLAMLRSIILSAGVMCVFASTAFSQGITVTGTVSESSGGSLGNVTVTIKGTSVGVAGDVSGRYSISVPNTGSVLVFSLMGFVSQEVSVGNRTIIDVVMKEDVTEISEVVVVGYGTLKRSEITASVSTLGEGDFNTTSAPSSILELAKGKIPGVVITNADGADPRKGTSLQIRGIASMRGTKTPLIVIDGVPGGDLSLVQSEDVESFSVLKDAAAAAIYGTRGSNGVVLITTKKASRGELSSTFEYSGYVSHDYVYNQPDVLSAAGYRDYMKSEKYNANMMVDFGDDTNWSDLLYNRNNVSQNHNLAMSGGNKKSNFRASVFYRDMNPVAIESNQSNWGGRLNVTHLGLNDRFEAQLNMSANLRTRNEVGENGAWEQASQRNPTEPSKDASGKWLEDQAYNSWNPLARYSTKEDESSRSTWLGSGRASIIVIDGLRASVMGSWQQYNQNRNQYLSRESKQSVDDVGGGGRAQKWFEKDVRKSLETTLDFVRTFQNIHSFNAVAGYSYEYHAFESFDAWNSGFLTDAFKYNNLGNGTGKSQSGTSRSDMGSTKRDDKIAAFFGRVNYVLKDKYQLSATYRYEGSSRFGINNRWGSFPALSAGWVLSRENFMENVTFVDNLKLRAGVGITGNIPDDNYLYMTTLSTGGQYPVGSVWYQTYGPARNPNPNLKWEKKEEWNIGVEYSVLNNRLGGTIDLYKRTTRDLLDEYNAQLPPYVLSTLWTNVGTVSNSGVEVGINASVLEGSAFSWDLNATFFYQKNKLISLSNDVYKATYKTWYGLPSPGALGDAIRTEEGQPLGQFYGKRFAGFDENGKWLFYNKSNEVVSLSDVKPDDLAYIGNGVPKYYASLSNTFRYKGFDLTVFFRGKFDYKILNLKELYFGNLNWLPNNVLQSATTKHAALHDAPQYSDYYLERGDFVKLDNLTLGYTFDIKNRDWIRFLRVYVSAQNLATFTGYGGTTPEVQDTGFETGIEGRSFYPATSTVMFGVNIKF